MCGLPHLGDVLRVQYNSRERDRFHPRDEGQGASALNIIDEFTYGASVSQILCEHFGNGIGVLSYN